MSSRWSLAEVINTQPWVILALHVAPNLLQLYGVGSVVQVELGHEVQALTERVTKFLHTRRCFVSTGFKLPLKYIREVADYILIRYFSNFTESPGRATNLAYQAHYSSASGFSSGKLYRGDSSKILRHLDVLVSG